MIRGMRKREYGFTLIEVMAGMLITSLGLLLLLPMMVTSIHANDYARGSTEASMLIKDKMEDLKNMDIPTSGADTVGAVNRTWTVATVSTNLRQIVVTINWTDKQGLAHSNSITSFKSAK
jgi:prepilin-type N-terminal cleavage/methylation domain-containing protein